MQYSVFRRFALLSSWTSHSCVVIYQTFPIRTVLFPLDNDRPPLYDAPFAAVIVALGPGVPSDDNRLRNTLGRLRLLGIPLRQDKIGVPLSLELGVLLSAPVAVAADLGIRQLRRVVLVRGPRGPQDLGADVAEELLEGRNRATDDEEVAFQLTKGLAVVGGGAAVYVPPYAGRGRDPALVGARHLRQNRCSYDRSDDGAETSV